MVSGSLGFLGAPLDLEKLRDYLQSSAPLLEMQKDWDALATEAAEALPGARVLQQERWVGGEVLLMDEILHHLLKAVDFKD